MTVLNTFVTFVFRQRAFLLAPPVVAETVSMISSNNTTGTTAENDFVGLLF